MAILAIPIASCGLNFNKNSVLKTFWGMAGVCTIPQRRLLLIPRPAIPLIRHDINQISRQRFAAAALFFLAGDILRRSGAAPTTPASVGILAKLPQETSANGQCSDGHQQKGYYFLHIDHHEKPSILPP